MTESRKRSRKSKLEVREDDCELEVVCDDTNNDTQLLQLPERPETSQRQKIIIYYPEEPFILDHDYCLPFTVSQPYYERICKPNCFKRPRHSSNSLTKTFSNYQEFNTPLKNNILKENLTKPKTGSENMDNNNKHKGKDDDTIRMCKFTPDLLYSESKKIAETSDNFADKILDIEMRNLWGNVLYTPNEVLPHDKKLQAAIISWQNWHWGSRSVREAPLFYQCHICEQAWWRLQPFQDHIKTHDSTMLIISMKEHLHESFIIASYEIVNKLIYIPIDGDCYRCGKNVEFHKESSLAYKCSRCSRCVYTCTNLREHESECLYVNLVIYNISIDRQCTICHHVLESLTLVQKHMIEAHSVRSDIPTHNPYKVCVHCGEKYFIYTMHNCSKSGRNSSCEHCCRKFSSSKLSINHVLSMHNRPMSCRICNFQLKAKCQEIEHLIEYHDTNYTMAYKCTLCSDLNLFMNERSIALHRQLLHLKKHDKRRLFFEKVVVPKSLLDGVVESILPDTGAKKTIQKKKENKKVDDTSLPSQSFSVLTADVKVTVDEIDVKKEPMEIDDNKEVDYEEMLLRMFNQSPSKLASNATVTSFDSKTEETVIYDHVYKLEEEFDYSSVKVKAEPIDDIDITENPVGEVEIKTEPIDPSEIDKEMMEGCFDYEEPIVKIENDEIDEFVIDGRTISEDITSSSDPTISSDPTNSNDPTISKHPTTSNDPTSTNDPTSSKDQTKSNNPTSTNDPTSSKAETDIEDEITIKEEFDETVRVKTEDTSTSPEPFQELITELEMFRDDKKTKTDLNYEYSIDVISSKGKLKQKKMYTCTKCGYTAHHKKYRLHMNTKCLVSPGINCSYPCSLCGRKFVMFKNYVLHFEKHGYDLMCCFICGDTFEVELKFLSHMHKHIKGCFVGVHMLDKSGEEIKRSQRRVTCMKCKETVQQDSMFSHWEENHLKLMEIKNDDEEPKLVIKEEVSPELTVDCERVTMNNKELEPAMLKLAIYHLKIDSNDKECIICYRVFSRRYDLKRHIVEHLLMDAHMKKIKYREFRCQICSDGFPHPEKYKFHMRGHGNMPIFMCELCNKTFSDSSNFAKHKKTHNVRCLVCDICKKKFHSKLALEKHIGEHYTKPLINCLLCSKTFHNKTSFKKHRWVHERPRYRCILCDMYFASVQSKWDHAWEVHQERRHIADCPICKKSFRKFSDVKIHARAEHNAQVNITKSEEGLRKNDLQINVKTQKKEKDTSMVCE